MEAKGLREMRDHRGSGQMESTAVRKESRRKVHPNGGNPRR